VASGQNDYNIKHIIVGHLQSIARILDPGNSRENKVQFFSLDLKKLVCISRSHLETWDFERKYLTLVSNPEMLREKISLSSRTLRCWEKNLALVSNPEMLRKKSRSRLELWDLKKKILVLVSNLEIESNFFEK